MTNWLEIIIRVNKKGSYWIIKSYRLVYNHNNKDTKKDKI